jgi:hypothetical protein
VLRLFSCHSEQPYHHRSIRYRLCLLNIIAGSPLMCAVSLLILQTTYMIDYPYTPYDELSNNCTLQISSRTSVHRNLPVNKYWWGSQAAAPMFDLTGGQPRNQTPYQIPCFDSQLHHWGCVSLTECMIYAVSPWSCYQSFSYITMGSSDPNFSSSFHRKTGNVITEAGPLADPTVLAE